MFIYLFLYTNNSKTLNDFTKLLNKTNHNKKTDIKLLFTQHQNKKQSKMFTVLKSPHVNKKAQDHFKLLKYRKKIKLCSFKLRKLLILLKKMQHNIFSDMHIKIKATVTRKKTKYFLLDPDTFVQNISKNILKSNFVTYLKIIDSFGEMSLQKNVYGTIKRLDSSAGRAKD